MEKVSIAIAITSGIATIISIAISTHPIISFVLGIIFGGSIMFSFLKRNTSKPKVEEPVKGKSISNETYSEKSTYFSDREFFNGYSYFWAMVNHHFKPFAKGSKDGIKYIIYVCNADDIFPAYAIIPEDKNRIKEFSVVRKHIEGFVHFCITELRHSKNWSVFFDEFTVIA